RGHVCGAIAPGEHRAHVVDGDAAAQLLGACLEPVAHLAVEIGERKAANAAFGGAADLGGLHQLAPQPLAVDPEIARRRHRYEALRNAAPAQSFGPTRRYCCVRGTSAPSACAACQPQRGSSSMARASATMSALPSAMIASACSGLTIMPTTRVAMPA